MSHDTHKKKFNVFDIFRDIEKLYGLLYLLLLVFIIFLGAKYVSVLDYNRLFSSPGLLAADTNMRAVLPVKKGTATPPVDVVKFTTPNQELIAKGKELFNTNCASCHGETGQGNGPAGAALNPPPRNFVNPQTWKNGPKMSNMYVTLQEGIPNTGMASFSNIPPEDRFAIIQYVQTFNPTFPKDSPDDLAKLDEKYNLSKGGKLPNQIPVSLAMDLEVLDYDTLRKDLENISSVIASDKDTAAVLFSGIVSNKTRALNSLAADMKWMASAEDFMKFIGTDPGDKGFHADVYQLSQENANRIYGYLRNLFAKNRV